MKFVKGCILLMLGVQFAFGQNLIPDSSFEKNRFVPMEFSAVNASHSWSIPSKGTSDLFCKCDRKTKILQEKIYSQVDVPQNPMGYQYPHSGNCYAGFFAFSHGDYREYLQTPLQYPLEKNKTYRFTMFISLADYSRASIDQLGLCFLTRKADYPFSDVITDLDPVYVNIEKEIAGDTKEWHRVTATYKAKGGEIYLLFGSFYINDLKKTKLKAPKDIKSRINQVTERDAYYFVDDMSLVEIQVEEKPLDTLVTARNKPVGNRLADSLFTLNNVLFNSNESTLLPVSYAQLDSLVHYLNRNLKATIQILGYTDNSGDEKTNKKISQGRAKAVADYLQLKGIGKARVSYKGFGSQKPIASNATTEGRQQNRRVECAIAHKGN